MMLVLQLNRRGLWADVHLLLAIGDAVADSDAW